jgi:hypothetical protein
MLLRNIYSFIKGEGDFYFILNRRKQLKGSKHIYSDSPSNFVNFRSKKISPLPPQIRKKSKKSLFCAPKHLFTKPKI